ncbi:prephenate dehydrogenase [Desulfurobacterium atlanticum]|uniref:prephenate dehydrogenase n=1 Tax=Desulfurobacterium atlanticum TaxID=240169 RepID=A0A238ZVM4_9BACT|nr:prephenate dehydrogenase/arogenate dehydrogenase family protein [Desulfurobacterium atlanticum]SNR86824.1 prephenate dehydrogenase [Desulfurobacterium atlanticum]
MEEFKEISIIGLGLIGGSFALNLKNGGFKGKITAVDLNPEAIEKGKELGIIDDGDTEGEAIKTADLVVIATPVGAYKSVIKTIKEKIDRNKKVIVTDLGSVKGQLVYFCEKELEGVAPFVGGHPIAGTEKSGVENSVNGLFKGAKFIITPTENTDIKAKGKIKQLWQKLGSEVIEMDPYYHDQIFASVSHLPHVVAYSIVDAIDILSKKFKTDLFQFTGGGFRDFTRIAMSDPVMWRDICIENKDNILEAIKTFKNALTEVEKLIEKNDREGLKKFFEIAREKRNKIQ